MEPTKPADIPPETSARPPVANSARKPECPSAQLLAIQFGLLPSSSIAGRLSVITERNAMNKKIGITRTQDLFDARLGVPNKDQKCATCGGTRRGPCDRPSSCDGHFGHIALATPIFHPLYVKVLPKFLSTICLGCGRVLEKKNRKNDLQEIFNRESGDEEEGSEKSAIRKAAPKRKVGAGASRKRKRAAKSPDISKRLMQDLERGEWAHSSMLDSNVEFPQQSGCKVELMGSPEASSPAYVPETPSSVRGKKSHSNDGESVLCNYCGGPDGKGAKFPKIKLKVVSKVVGKRSRVDSIQMVVDEKAGVLPTGFWDFVDGHPSTGVLQRTRTLLASEASKILNKIPPNEKTLVGNPPALIIRQIPVPPNCNRLVMEDWSSTLTPRVLQRKGGQANKLEAIVRKCSQIKEAFAFDKMDYSDLEKSSEATQLLVARHFRACKVVEYNMTGQEVEQTGGTLELKWLKDNVLGKRSNYSARTIINGDPFIGIEEIGIPKEIALKLTVEEKISTLNIRKWQKFVDDYIISDQLSTPGVLLLKKKKENMERDLRCLRRTTSQDQQIKLGLGDTITRCLKDGDPVFANRPPSVHKHSLVALKVKVHSLSTIAINPLICPPFDADFDGDAFHIFVPQSLESKVETQELMTVNAQLISSQGGQPIIGLTQDSLLAGHLLTSGHVFINRNDMEQLSMWCSSQIPIPAIVKSPTKTGALWTGKQLFSMTLPDGLNFGTSYWTGTPLGATISQRSFQSAEGDVLVVDGEILICQGRAKWLDRTPNGILRAICNHVGPVATVEHLDCLQAVLHQWLLITGFSVGMRDFYVAEGAQERKNMLKGVQKSLEKSNEASLRQALRLDRQYQHRRLFPEQGGTSSSNTVVEEHQGCFGLLLGERKCTPRVAALQVVAIEKFQALAPDIENLVSGYMDKNNSLLAMVRSGSKGSMVKLTQQVGCLGLQLYKGERLIPIQRNHKLSYSLEKARLDVFSETKAEAGQEGYWESRGIIKSSYMDGLNAREFFMDSISSRCNVMRQGIEEPNQILRNLLLFMRDMRVAYDGTVRIGSCQSIIQFQYGTGKRCFPGKDPSRPAPSLSSEDPEDQWADSVLAGEPVGVLAATAIAEPAYYVRMQSIHQTQVLGTGPVQLLKEVLMVRAKTKMKVNDRRSILRLPMGFGKERRALDIQMQLQRVTLETITLSCAIEYVRLDKKMYVNTATGKDGPPFLRLSPWMGHIQLCQKTLDQNRLNKRAIVELLNKKHCGNPKGDSYEIYFSYSDRCISNAHPGSKGLCIWFFPVNPPESLGAASKEQYQENMALLLESMKSIMLPAILNTTIRGSDNIEKVRILWEDSGSASRLPEESTSLGSHQPSLYQAKRPDWGELVVEVVVKAPKGGGKRGASWLMVLEACIPVIDLIDWRRSTPYAIQEIYVFHGVEAARHIILKRLTVAAKAMNRPLHQKHMILVADTMTHCGEVIGLGSAGHREFCRHMSISAPFTEAAFQQPKKTILDAAAGELSESFDGALASAVWGLRVPLGTGVSFQINPKEPEVPKWPRDPLELWEELRETKAAPANRRPKWTKENSSVTNKSMKTQSLFQKSKLAASYLDLLEDMDLAGDKIFQGGKLAGMLLGKGNDFTKAALFQYSDAEFEVSQDRFDDANKHDLPASGEDEHESTHRMATLGLNEWAKGPNTQNVKFSHFGKIAPKF